MDLFSRLEKKLFVDDYSKYLVKFLEDKELICQQCNSEKWKDFFEKIERWKKQYLISIEVLEIYGVNGWYVDLAFSQFQYSTYIELNIEEYAAIILLIDWILLFDGDEYEYKCYESHDFAKTLHLQFDYSKSECAQLSKSQFFNELQDIYDRSYDRFQYYKHNLKNNNPELIAIVETQYPKYYNQINLLKNNLNDCRIMRLNSFGRDENVWYLIKSSAAIYSICIMEII